MPYRDLRDFIQKLEEEGDLKRIAAEVDWNVELGAIARKTLDQEGPALLFENIKRYGPGHPFFCGTLSSYSKFALALGLPKESSFKEIIAAYKNRTKRGIPPKIVSSRDAPCKENIHIGEEVDLFEFPTPWWHHRDGGQYLGTFHCNAVKDPDSNWVNVALCRLMIQNKRDLGILMLPGQHTYLIYRKYQALGKNMPIAISIGQDPVNVIAAYGSFEIGTCEWEMAGGLREEPVVMVKCETSDLLVPATAEIVIEGEVPPDELREEGPFGEYTGYYGGMRDLRPVVKVNCITHRNNPINTGLLEGKPMQENNIMNCIANTGALEAHLNDELKLGIKDIIVHPWAANHGVIVSLKPVFPGHVNRVAHAIWGCKAGRARDYVIVVDEDIDPTKLDQVLWAICTRCKPDRDIITFLREEASGLWPCLTPREREQALGARVLIDATFPAEWPRDWVAAVSDWWDYPEEVRNRVEANWERYGF